MDEKQRLIEVEKLKATKIVSSEELENLSNEQIALRLYYLVANGTNKSFSDFYDIGNHFGSIAANLRK